VPDIEENAELRRFKAFLLFAERRRIRSNILATIFLLGLAVGALVVLVKLL
jgi:hypothetical protein